MGYKVSTVQQFYFGIVIIGVDFPYMMSYCSLILSTTYRLHCQITPFEQKNSAIKRSQLVFNVILYE